MTSLGWRRARIRKVVLYLKQRPFLATLALLAGIFVFLLVRNWDVFALPDIYDGSVVKLDIMEYGFTGNGLREYADEYIFTSFNNAFLPVWLGVYYGLSWFDNNPVLLGFFSFAIASCIMLLIGRIVFYFYPKPKQSWLYAVCCGLLFVGSLFFLEVIAWKWMASLLLSTAGFLLCLYLLLEKTSPSTRLKWLYAAVLLCSVWTFGTGWILAWALVLFLLLARSFVDGKRSPYLPISIGVATLGTICTFLVNVGTDQPFNLLFLLVHLPSMLVLITVNCILSIFGVFRFSGISDNLMGLSSIVGITVLGMLAYAFYQKLKTRKLSQKEALCLALLVGYCVLIAMSLFRLMPASGLTPTSEFESYIFGNRYLFAFSVPLFLIAAILLGKPFLRLHKVQRLIVLVGVVSLGFGVQAIYATSDPAITDPKRKVFYDLTIPALQAAHNQGLSLPALQGDVLFKGAPIALPEAVFIRKDSPRYPVTFVSPDQLSADMCGKLHNNTTINIWLNTYNTNWCKP